MYKQFVTYEIALKLKELGFDEGCLGDYYIIPSDKTPNPNGEFLGLKYEDVSSYTKLVSAPLWQQVVDWFRSRKVLIEISPVDDWNSWCFSISMEDIMSPFFVAFISSEYNSYELAHEQSILKAIELCQN